MINLCQTDFYLTILYKNNVIEPRLTNNDEVMAGNTNTTEKH